MITSQGTSMQAVGFDGLGYFYVTQLIKGGVQFPDEPAPLTFAQRRSSGDFAINKYTLDGNLIDVMYVRGAGHGVTLAFERNTNRIWIDADASSSGFGRALARITFTSGAVLDSLVNTEVFRPFGPASGSHGVSASIDPVFGKFSIRRTFPDPDNGFDRRYYLYELSDAVQGIFSRPLATVDQRANDGVTPDSIGTFQGHQSYDKFFYTLDGDPLANNIYITSLSWDTGETIDRQFISDRQDLYYREPEGITLWAESMSPNDIHKLVFGIAYDTDNDRKYTTQYIPTRRVNIGAPGTYGIGGYGEGGFGGV